MNNREVSSGSRRTATPGEEVRVFEKFTDQARQVVILAAGAAHAHHQNSVGTAHLLLASSTTPPPPAPTSSPTSHPRPSATCASTSDAN